MNIQSSFTPSRPPRFRSTMRAVETGVTIDAMVDERQWALDRQTGAALLDIVPCANIASSRIFMDTLNDIGSDHLTARQQLAPSKSLATAQVRALAKLMNEITDNGYSNKYEGRFVATVLGMNPIAFDRFAEAYYKQPRATKDAMRALTIAPYDWPTLASAFAEACLVSERGDYPDNTLKLTVARIVELLAAIPDFKLGWNVKPVGFGNSTEAASPAARFLVTYFKALDSDLPPERVLTGLKRCLEARSQKRRLNP